jgi:hypothetical protein
MIVEKDDGKIVIQFKRDESGAAARAALAAMNHCTPQGVTQFAEIATAIKSIHGAGEVELIDHPEVKKREVIVKSSGENRIFTQFYGLKQR